MSSRMRSRTAAPSIGRRSTTTASPPSIARRRKPDAAPCGPCELSRRRFLGGASTLAAGIAGSATLTWAGAGPAGASRQETDGAVLVVVFLRGGMDGLSAVVPADDLQLVAARPDILVPSDSLLQLDRSFGLHPALEPLYPFWEDNRMAVVPAIAMSGISRSHFQAQDALERGGAESGSETTTGWLDRVMARLEPGTPLQGVGQGPTLPRSLVGTRQATSIHRLDAFDVVGPEDTYGPTLEALRDLYAEVSHPLADDALATLDTLDMATVIRLLERRQSGDGDEDDGGDGYELPEGYPETDFGKGLAELARLIRAGAGVEVAAIDMGGWDTHTNMGDLDRGRMQNQLGELGDAVGAFFADLGDQADNVTLVTMSEFGRRIEANGSGGTDHGHGGVSLVLGGGVNGGVHGEWNGVPGPDEDPDLPGLNDYRDLLGEVAANRLGLSGSDLSYVFPEHQYRPLGVMA